ncbi:MAG: multidrug effflux MFS transporter [Pseudomonadota bacterium]
MTTRSSGQGPGFIEFVGFMALTVSIVALSIDAMLPSLPEIAEELQAPTPNDRQLVVSVFILGMSVSPVLFGLAADAHGRRPAMIAGLWIFAAGCVVSATAASFETMLLGRFLQGVGAAGPRTLAVTVVRDRYEGRAMAQVMSFIMTIFILVPALAPSLGLLVESLSGWRAVFVVLLSLSGLIFVWISLRLPETLAEQDRRPLRWRTVSSGLGRIFRDRTAMGYTLATGFAFAPFLAYLSASEQILADRYGWGDGFVLVFGGLALVIGAAAFVNAHAVMKLGMRRLTGAAQLSLMGCSTVAAAVFAVLGSPSFAVFLVWMIPAMFFSGILFGNVNALAMQPLGAMAGLGAALVGSLSNALSVPIGIGIARAYDGEPTPLAIGFAICAACSWLCARWAESGQSAISLREDAA